MSAVIKLTEKQAIDVCYLSVEYLTSRCMLEKGLFRNPPSVVEIRKLRTHMLNERHGKSHPDIMDSALDPHLVAGVLQLTLKDMSRSVFDKIYADMMGSANESADFSRNKGDVVRWMCKFDADRFQLVQAVVAFIHQLGTTPGNDANISQLVFIFAPLLCRPSDSAYMSVRHMEDLRKLRPTLQVIVENYVEIFRESHPCSEDEAAGSGSGNQPRSLTSDMETYPIDTKESEHSKSPDDKAFSPREESPTSAATTLKKKKISLNLQVSVATAPTTDVNDTTSPISTVAARQVNYQSKEWNKLEQLVFSLSESFFKEPFHFFNPTKAERLSHEPSGGDSGMIMSNENDLMACTIETYDAGHVGFGGGDMDSPSRDLGETDEGGYWTQGGGAGPTGELFNRGRAPMSPGQRANPNGAAHRASNRRKMVHECRALRQQITKFEKDWATVHNRNPKGGEKGHMQPIYSKYRDMKREIRSSAAVDIQRLIRGFVSRGIVRKGTGFLPTSPSHYARSPPKHSSSPKKSNLLSEMMSPPKSGGGGGTASSRGEYDQQQSVDSNMWKSGDAEEMIVNSGADSNAKVLYSQYKDLLLQKRTLKRRLKRFDEDFAAKHNRQPKKTDKEVMRPHYQKYHEVRNDMQVLKAKIEREVGSLPAELQEAPDGDTPSSHSHGTRPSSESSSDRPSRGSSGGGGGGGGGGGMEQSASTPQLTSVEEAEHNSGQGGGEEEEDELMARFESQQQDGGRRDRGNAGDTAGSGSLATGWLSASRTGTEPNRPHSSGGGNSVSSADASNVETEKWSRASSNSPADLEVLQKEKRQLHIVLKAYER
jgi:hypothetical protein